VPEERADAVIIGAGINGLVCACYLAIGGMSVIVLEAGREPGGCLYTVDLPGEDARLEIGGYEHGGLRASGVGAELELETRFGLRMIERDELLYAPCDDGTALAFHQDLDRTVDLLGPVVGPAEAERYRSFSLRAKPAAQLVYGLGAHLPAGIGELMTLARAALGAQGARLVQTFLAPASSVLRATFEDDRLRGALGQWSANAQQAPNDVGTGAGALLLSALHGHPTARPAGGSRATIAALVDCLSHHGGLLLCDASVERVEMSGGRAKAVVVGGSAVGADDAVISSIDPRQLFGSLVSPGDMPSGLRDEVRRIRSGTRNIAEFKIDALVAGTVAPVAVEGFERAFMVSANTLQDLEDAFNHIALRQLPRRPPLMMAVPSALEPGWAPPGRDVLWVQTRMPWHADGGNWSGAELEQAAQSVWKTVELVFSNELPVTTWVLTGPAEWCERIGGSSGNPNHVDMSLDQMLNLRPSPSLSGYRTPIPGLYLTGAGTHPGGGISGHSGRNTARVVLGDAKVFGARRRRLHVRDRLALARDGLRAIRDLRGGP
jgi:beta-carotene ketolase (CrtO type)